MSGNKHLLDKFSISQETKDHADRLLTLAKLKTGEGSGQRRHPSTSSTLLVQCKSQPRSDGARNGSVYKARMIRAPWTWALLKLLLLSAPLLQSIRLMITRLSTRSVQHCVRHARMHRQSNGLPFALATSVLFDVRSSQANVELILSTNAWIALPMIILNVVQTDDANLQWVQTMR